MIDNLVDQLIRDEGGFKLAAYKDSLGFWTIGCGHKLNVPSDKPSNLLWTLDQCKAQLQADASTAVYQLRMALPWVDDLDVPRRGALQNMTFNMGIHKLLGFKNTLALLEGGKYDEAAEEMLNSLWAKQVGARAHRLSEQIWRGQWV